LEERIESNNNPEGVRREIALERKSKRAAGKKRFEPESNPTGGGGSGPCHSSRERLSLIKEAMKGATVRASGKNPHTSTGRT